jgi:hypothetical protein
MLENSATLLVVTPCEVETISQRTITIFFSTVVAASVGGFFHFNASMQCRLMAQSVISLRRKIWSLLG